MLYFSRDDRIVCLPAQERPIRSERSFSNVCKRKVVVSKIISRLSLHLEAGKVLKEEEAMLLVVLADNPLHLNLNALDFAILIIYFALVIAIGLLAKRAIATSEDFLLAGRSLPAWITGLAFISANLGAIEILGMAANGAQYGWSSVHFYWIGAVPAMVFLGMVMMPFYYGSR